MKAECMRIAVFLVVMCCFPDKVDPTENSQDSLGAEMAARGVDLCGYLLREE